MDLLIAELSNAALYPAVAATNRAKLDDAEYQKMGSLMR